MMAALSGSLQLKYREFILDMTFSLPGSSVTVIMGASGSGKSTFLRCLAGLERADGELSFAGSLWQSQKTFTPTYARGLGFVFQDENLFPHLGVEENLRLGMSKKKSENTFDWDHVLEVFHLEKLFGRNVASLSGGEKQRLSIARTLLSSPKLLLMDEPLSALDAKSKREVLPYIESIKSEFGIPIVYVTHSVLEASRIADYILIMQNGKCKEFNHADEILSKNPLLQESFTELIDLQNKFGMNI